MKKTNIIFIICLMQNLLGMAQIGAWKAYPAYYNITEIQPAGKIIYVLASNGLYAYNSNDHSIQTFDKSTVLSDVDIAHIAYNKSAKCLFILYKNYNIDLLSSNGTVKNLSDYYSKVMTDDKTVNFITIDNIYAYLSTGFGIIKINMRDGEINETYYLKEKTKSCTILNNQIFAAVNNKILKGDTSKNLLDYKNWTTFSTLNVDQLFQINSQLIGSVNGSLYSIHSDGTYQKIYEPLYTQVSQQDDKIIFLRPDHFYVLQNSNEISEYDAKYSSIAYDSNINKYWIGNIQGQLQQMVISNNELSVDKNVNIKVEGPKYNNFGFLKFDKETLYSCGGGYEVLGDQYLPGNIQTMNAEDQWSTYGDSLQAIVGHDYLDNVTLDLDPNNKKHLFTGGRTGLYEFNDGQFIKNYSFNNSLLQSALPTNNPNYVLVKGMKFDNQGNLWILNSQAKSQSLLELTKNGEWISHHKPELMYNNQRSLGAMQGMIFDSRNLLWFVNDHWDIPSFYCYQPTSDQLNAYTTFINEDGKIVPVTYVHCVMEDLDHNIWIGTDVGPLVLNDSQIGNSTDVEFDQIKVPRNDGTNLADYLLNGVDIISMAVDGAGRKWFGTKSNGAYLISQDNLQQIHHFTVDNSKLLSNTVQSIAIDDKNGKVFFGTSKGLCSYSSDASGANDEMTKDNVYAYPNPVEPNYSGLITVIGLTFNADVKIVTSNGILVAQGKSHGGTFTWDGSDLKGNRVASGVYMVQTATSEGKSGIVCKIAIVR